MKKLKRTSKTYKLLSYVSSLPPRGFAAGGASFRQMQKFVYALRHPSTPFTEANRGYWCNNLLDGHASRGMDRRPGIISKYMTKGPDGLYRLNRDGWLAVYDPISDRLDTTKTRQDES